MKKLFLITALLLSTAILSFTQLYTVKYMKVFEAVSEDVYEETAIDSSSNYSVIITSQYVMLAKRASNRGSQTIYKYKDLDLEEIETVDCSMNPEVCEAGFESFYLYSGKDFNGFRRKLYISDHIINNDLKYIIFQINREVYVHVVIKRV